MSDHSDSHTSHHDHHAHAPTSFFDPSFFFALIIGALAGCGLYYSVAQLWTQFTATYSLNKFLLVALASGGLTAACYCIWRQFFQDWIFSTDHKIIGCQYGVTSLVFLFLGFCLVMLMRWQIAYPNQAIPVVGHWVHNVFGDLMMAITIPDPNDPAKTIITGYAISPDLYNVLGAMHGTIMVFLGVVPLAVGAFGNYFVPLQIGAQDMAFPKLNMASYWVYFCGGIVMLCSFFVPHGGAQSGWTSYPPLSNVTFPGLWTGQTMWIMGMFLLIVSSLLGSVNTIVTIVQMRTKGLTWMRLPFFVWTQLVTAFLLVLAFPPLQGAATMQFMDRVFGTSFFLPTGLHVGGKPLEVSGGGSALLWQHLFWFLAHPEVYVLILPAMGIVGEVIANNTRKPLWGYKSLVGAAIFLGFMSFIVWAHHMFLTGMGAKINVFFQTTTMIISVPSIIILTALILSLWGGSIRFNVPMLFALAFLPMFGIGGLTGLPLGLSQTDVHLHDTYYVIGHFHYVVAPGTLFALFAGIYYWFPKITGKKLNDAMGKIHFWGSFLCMNGIFLPMIFQGLAGVLRRGADGGASYTHTESVLWMNKVMSHSAWLMAIFQLIFIINFIWTLWRQRRADADEKDNPWGATTLEWAAPTPPLPHRNFEHSPVVYRGPYEYSDPQHGGDYMQHEPDGAKPSAQ